MRLIHNARSVRLALCGAGRAGKDTAALWLANNTTLQYKQSTSQAAAEVVFAQIAAIYGYATVDEAFNDRHNHRDEWYDIIRKYNEPDGLRLYREMLPENDIINGIRDGKELLACQQTGIVDLSIWISRPGYDGGPGTHTIAANGCDITIVNAADIPAFYAKLTRIAAILDIQRTPVRIAGDE